MICSAVIDRWVLNVDERYDFDVAAMFWKSTNEAFFYTPRYTKHT